MDGDPKNFPAFVVLKLHLNDLGELRGTCILDIYRYISPDCKHLLLKHSTLTLSKLKHLNRYLTY